MLLTKLRASLSPLFYGENGIIPATSKLVFYNRGSSFRSRGIRLLYRPLHSAAQDDFSELDEPKQDDAEGVDNPEDDEWSELGSVEEEKIVIPKLMTEKPEPLWKPNEKRKASALASLLANDTLNSKALPSKPTPTTGHELKTQNSSSSSITVPNVPSSVAWSQDVESRRQTLAAGHVNLKNANLKIQPGEAGHLVRIKISNLNSGTADSVIHSKCMSLGPLEGLATVDENTVTALFRVRDLSEAEPILVKLNNTIIDDFQWSASLQSRMPTPAAVVSKPETSQDPLGLQISSCADDLRTQITMLKIHVEDLEMLLHSILHLENHPIANRD